jgi:hypothetical protein
MLVQNNTKRLASVYCKGKGTPGAEIVDALPGEVVPIPPENEEKVRELLKSKNNFDKLGQPHLSEVRDSNNPPIENRDPPLPPLPPAISGVKIGDQRELGTHGPKGLEPPAPPVKK